MASGSSLMEDDGYRPRPAGYRYPTWWFVVMAAPTILPGLFQTAFSQIVWPAAIASMAGFNEKAFVFAACGQVAMVMSWSAPFVGAFSDKVPLWLARRFGRRRPFIVAGRFCSVVGNLLIYIAMVGLDKPCAWLLGLGLVVMNLGGCLASPAFNAVVPDMVPLDQRGLCLTIGQWTSTTFGLLGWGVGWMLGEKIFFTDALLWKINILMWGLDLPLFLIACNGEAGWWMSEHLADLEQEEEQEEEGDQQLAVLSGQGRGRGRGRGGALGACLSCGWSACVGFVAMVRDFVSSFKYPTYKWYWIWLAVNAFSGMVESSFQYFWLQVRLLQSICTARRSHTVIMGQ
jgi:hypothetical protein